MPPNARGFIFIQRMERIVKQIERMRLNPLNRLTNPFNPGHVQSRTDLLWPPSPAATRGPNTRRGRRAELINLTFLDFAHTLPPLRPLRRTGPAFTPSAQSTPHRLHISRQQPAALAGFKP